MKLLQVVEFDSPAVCCGISTDMNIKIFHPMSSGYVNKNNDPAMFFDMAVSAYTWENDPTYIGEIDVMLLDNPTTKLHLSYDYTPKIMLDVFHNYENQLVNIHNRKLTDYYTVTNCVDYTIDDNTIIFNDFLFNRTKAYYSQFPFNYDTNKWYYRNQFDYQVPVHPNALYKNKIFVAPNNSRTTTQPTIFSENIELGIPKRELKYRRALVQHLLNYQQYGYLGDVTLDSKLCLHAQGDYPACSDINELLNKTVNNPERIMFGSYSPVHNEYYKDTFVSIYCETVEFGTTTIVTEKTYDPLIKGHFILPFSNANFIQHLRMLGFEFPSFINYEYDSIQDDALRFESYIAEMKRLLSLSNEVWQLHWVENIDIIYRNQLYFHIRPYDMIDFKLLEDERIKDIPS